jgi:hypothetical protein
MGAVRAKNRYYHRRCFAVDLNAADTARLTGVSVRSVNTIFLKIRRRIKVQVEQRSVFDHLPEHPGSNIVAFPSPHAGSRATGRAPMLFGVHWRDDQVHTELLPERELPVLHDLIRGRRQPEDLFGPQQGGWRYHALADLGHRRCLRLQCPGSDSPANAHATRSLDAFWGFTLHRLQQFRGFHRHTFDLHLKETEFRFNHSRDALYPELLRMLREQPL